MKKAVNLVVPAALLVAGCGSYGSSSSADPGTVQVQMNAQNIQFDPSTISAKPGEKIALTVANHDGFTHNFSVSELSVSQDVPAGQSSTFVFTATGGADLQYFCKYHKSKGMVGTLNLSGSAPAPTTSAPASGGSAPSAGTSPYAKPTY